MRTILTALAGMALSGAALAGPTTVLFDASLGTAPSDQDWPLIRNPILSHSVTETPGPSFTTLDSFGPKSDQGGYFSNFADIFVNPNVPTLDRSAGVTLRFDVRVVGESHVLRDDNGDGVDDRAGFSVIMLAEDTMGLELAFWEDEVWAYDDDSSASVNLFTHAEGVLLDTTGAITPYELTFFNGFYTVRRATSGPQAPLLLSGPLRDYSAFSGSVDPYETPSFIFLGDDTSSAESAVEIAYISVEQSPDAPCPADVTTTGATDGQPSFGAPDDTVDLTDLLYFVNLWSPDVGTPSPNPTSEADLTTTGAALSDASYGEPDGNVDLSDLLYYVNLWNAGRTLCP